MTHHGHGDGPLLHRPRPARPGLGRAARRGEDRAVHARRHRGRVRRRGGHRADKGQGRPGVADLPRDREVHRARPRRQGDRARGLRQGDPRRGHRLGDRAGEAGARVGRRGHQGHHAHDDERDRPAAQFGRGVMVEVGGKLVEQFAQNLRQLITDDSAGGGGAAAGEAGSTEASAAADGGASCWGWWCSAGSAGSI